MTAGADGGAFYDDATLQTNIANNTTAITAETTRATAAENAIQADVDANETAATNAINAVQTDVDTNEADADAAIAAANTAIALKEDAANKSTNVALGTSDVDFPTQNAVKTYVDAQVAGSTQVIVSTDADNDVTAGADGGAFYDDAALQTNIANNTTAITAETARATAAENAIQADVDANETAATNAINAVQTDVDTNEADADAAIALKEDATNKSTNVALGTSDDAFPTQNAVKTYVDAQVAGSTQVIVSTDADNDVTAGADGGAFYDDAALQTNIANNTTAITAETTRATAAENAIQADVDANETAATNAINAVQTDVDTNEADADAAIALKEDATNKSTNVALGTSDDAFPTQNAVKTYVDAQVAGSTQVIVSTDADNDVTAGADGGAFYDDAALQTNIANNTTAITAETTRATAAENAIQADVDANETTATNAINTVQTDVDTNEADADAAIAAANTAIALKEDAANKSTNVALGTSDDAFPTQNAVKTYVDTQVLASDQIIVSTDVDNDVTAGADGGAFYDDAALQTNIANNTTAITAETTRATAAENAIQADVDANETAATNAINTVQTDVNTNEADADAAIAAANTAIALKEDAANKSANVALGTSDDAFPTQNAVKTYVDAQVLASDQIIVSTDADNDVTAGADGGAFYDDAALQTNIANNTTAITAETTRATAAENAIQADVDANETAATNAINAVQTDVNTNEADADAAIALKEDAANKSDAVDLGDTTPSATLFPTQNAVKTYVDTQISGIIGGSVTTLSQNNTSGVISYVNESAVTQTADVISTDANNDVTPGTDGGAFYNSMVKAIGKVNALGIVVKGTTGVTVVKQIGLGHYRVNLPVGTVADANYIIQLSQPGRGGLGNDDPGISYSNQTATGFDVIMGDNDNGGTDRARFDSEFMFVILDL
ncbi:hypothetical protein SAMN05660313_03388 [Cellulophaga fucicola]|uniref:Uncharacterized protein n=1 Tax=Cellulophaga fucicola TaxID=76595 RepID=A0A1K1R8L4_9FLAO|nr:hypothetical protein SAMN05660313_03388 [Cellulophaga fucicola]